MEQPPHQLAIRNQYRWLGALILAMAIALAACVWWATRGGIGLSPDSMSYVLTSRFFAAGKGVVHFDDDGKIEVFTHLAPALMVLLGTLQAAHIDLFHAARWINLFSLAGSVAICAMLIAITCRKPFWPTLLGTLVLFSFIPMLRLFAMLVSEPIFCFAWLASVLLMLVAFIRPSRGWLITAAIAAALTSLSRYAGIGISLAMAIAVLIHIGNSRGKRIANAITFLFISLAPLTAWVIFGFLRTHRLGNRQLLFHPPTLDQWHQLGNTLAGWVIPARWQAPMGAGLGIFFAVLVLVAVIDIRRRRKAESIDTGSTLRTMLWLIAAGYAAFILMSVTFFDAYTPLDDRIFLPLRVSLFVIAATLLLDAGRGWWRCIAIAAFSVLAAFQSVALLHWIDIAPATDMGLNSLVWRRSPTVKFGAKIPRNRIVYTNITDAMYLLNDRLCKSLPDVIDLNTAKSSEDDYRAKLPVMQQDLQLHHGYVIYFRRLKRPAQVTEQRLKTDLHLRLVHDFTDGGVYELDAPAGSSTEPTTQRAE